MCPVIRRSRRRNRRRGFGCALFLDRENMRLQHLLVVSVFFLFTITSVLVFGDDNAADRTPSQAKILYFTRSQTWEHDPVKLQSDGTTISGTALKNYCQAKNIELVETQDGRIFDGDIEQYDAFVFYTSGNLEEEEGSKNATSHAISDFGMKKLFAAVETGKGFVAIHPTTESTCKQPPVDGIDPFTKLIGALFIVHGPMQTAAVSIIQPAQQPFFQDKGESYSAFEEWYTMHHFNPDMHILLVMQTQGMEGDCYHRPPYPVSWIRMQGQGRVAYTAFGHANEYWLESKNMPMVGDLIEWSLGRLDFNLSPNLQEVAPGAEILPEK